MQYQQSKDQAEPKEVTTEFDLTQIPKPELSGHAWRQQGTMLICQSCPFTHTTTITDENGNPAVDYQLYGIDKNGYPKFRKIKF